MLENKLKINDSAELAREIRDIEIKHVLRKALTDKTDSREVYMKGIDNSYFYEGYKTYKTEELQKLFIYHLQKIRNLCLKIYSIVNGVRISVGILYT